MQPDVGKLQVSTEVDGQIILAFRLRTDAGLGLCGYVAVIASVLRTRFGVIDTKAGSGQLLYVPAGLFEALVFPLWLIFKAFAPAAQEA